MPDTPARPCGSALSFAWPSDIKGSITEWRLSARTQLLMGIMSFSVLKTRMVGNWEGLGFVTLVAGAILPPEPFFSHIFTVEFCFFNVLHPRGSCGPEP